jgi:hypothetical protein
MSNDTDHLEATLIASFHAAALGSFKFPVFEMIGCFT